MTDESRASKPQPPNDRSTNVKSVANISAVVVAVVAVVSAVGGIIVSVIVLVTFVVTFVVVVGGGGVNDDGGGVVGDVGGAAVIVSAVVGAVVSVGVGIVGGIVVSAVVNSVAFITFIGNAVRGVSQLRLTLQHTGAAAPFAVAVWIGGRNRRWQAEDWLVALTESPRPIRYSLGLVVAATRMRLYDLGGLLVKAARWVLASNRRTWWPLGSLLTLAAVNIHLAQGWGSAFYTLPTIVGFHLGVEWLRHRWGIELKPKLPVGDPGRNQ